jgi:hypothetical protein
MHSQFGIDAIEIELAEIEVEGFELLYSSQLGRGSLGTLTLLSSFCYKRFLNPVRWHTWLWCPGMALLRCGLLEQSAGSAMIAGDAVWRKYNSRHRT